MEKILIKAKFGQRFRTKGDNVVVYDYYNSIRDCHIVLCKGIGELPYNDNGKICGFDCLDNYEIVDYWDENEKNFTGNGSK